MIRKALLFSFFLYNLIYASPKKFEDINKDHWAYKSINNLLEKDIIREDSYEFNGNRAITKYEFVYSLSKILEQINIEKLNQKELRTFEILMNQFSDELNNIYFDTSTYEERLQKIDDKVEILKEKVDRNEKIIKELLKKVDRLEKRR